MTKEIFQRISDIIENKNNINNYTITGYKMVETKLTVHYKDCNEIFIFKDYDNKVDQKSFYTRNHCCDDFEKSHKEFKKLHNKHIR